jgi:hydrogenase-4 component F
MAWLLVLMPLTFAAIAFAITSDRLRAWLVTAAGFLQLPLVFLALRAPRVEGLNGWLCLDALGKVVLGAISVLFAACALYVPGYLAQRRDGNARLFCAAMLSFFAVLTLMTETHHLGLLWVAMEAGTLSTAPLLYFHRTPRSLEAVWKYLLIGSVGIALALLGCFFLGYSALHSGHEASLELDELLRIAPHLSKSWLHAAFILLVVGYGTKMGLAPMHTWKPDAYGEAPGVVGTLLAGGLTSGAFLAILRVYQVCCAAGDARFARQPLIVLGLVSMLIAGVFMARQKDFKRMLAYSSVEHMGILVLGVGIGGAAHFGSMLHLVNNSLTKGVLFMSAGNIHRVYASKSTDDVKGAFRRAPVSAWLLLCGFFAITGSPPFGPFLSEFTIVSAAMQAHNYVIAALFIGMLAIVFIGMGSTVLAVVQGEPEPSPRVPTNRETFLTVTPAILLLGLVLMLGVYVPPPLSALLHAAAALLENP